MRVTGRCEQVVAEREEQSLAGTGIRDSVGIQRLMFEQRFAQY